MSGIKLGRGSTVHADSRTGQDSQTRCGRSHERSAGTPDEVTCKSCLKMVAKDNTVSDRVDSLRAGQGSAPVKRGEAAVVVLTPASMHAAFDPDGTEVFCGFAGQPALTNDGFCQFCGSTKHDPILPKAASSTGDQMVKRGRGDRMIKRGVGQILDREINDAADYWYQAVCSPDPMVSADQPGTEYHSRKAALMSLLRVRYPDLDPRELADCWATDFATVQPMADAARAMRIMIDEEKAADVELAPTYQVQATRADGQWLAVPADVCPIDVLTNLDDVSDWALGAALMVPDSQWRVIELDGGTVVWEGPIWAPESHAERVLAASGGGMATGTAAYDRLDGPKRFRSAHGKRKVHGHRSYRR